MPFKAWKRCYFLCFSNNILKGALTYLSHRSGFKKKVQRHSFAKKTVKQKQGGELNKHANNRPGRRIRNTLKTW